MGDFGRVTVEQVVSKVRIVLLSRDGGETGLVRAAILLAALSMAAALGAVAVVEVMTVSGLGRGRPPTGAAVLLVGFTIPPTMAAAVAMEGCTTGLKLEGAAAGWNKAGGGTLPVVGGAREMMGVGGSGKATLKRGRGSLAAATTLPTFPAAAAAAAATACRLAGGERLSGDALGGVSGA